MDQKKYYIIFKETECFHCIRLSLKIVTSKNMTMKIHSRLKTAKKRKLFRIAIGL